MSKRLIFTVTTGRSGSSFLAYQLSHLKKINVFHEPEPRFNSHIHNAAIDSEYAKKFLKEVKLKFINSLPEQIYIETSHFFCKGFFNPLIELGIIPDLILLSRDRLKVAKSMYELGTIPGNSKDYLYANEFQYVDTSNWDTYHDFQKCLLYHDEITIRQREYGKIIKNNGGKVFSICTEDLNDRNKFSQLINDLDLPGFSFTGRLKYEYRHRIKPLKTNLKEGEKTNKIDAETIDKLSSGLT